jgi:hypothetical protein
MARGLLFPSVEMSKRSYFRVLALILPLAGVLSSFALARQDQTEVEAPDTNACGCFEESPGVCMCLRKSRCGCPGECEPVGCEEERQKDLARRMEQELKKLREQADAQPGSEQQGGDQ